MPGPSVIHSPAMQRLRERCNGRDLCQFSMITGHQFDRLVLALDLKPGDRVLDLGSGLGRIAHTIATQTGAKVTGIDTSDGFLAEARSEHGDTVEFLDQDFDTLPWDGPTFDAIYSSDTLYFSKDLDALVAKLRTLLTPGGRLCALWSQNLKPDGDPALLTPEGSKLGSALAKAGFVFDTESFDDEERHHWEESERALAEMKDELLAEGFDEFVEDYGKEVAHILPSIRANRFRRYLYKARVQ